MRGLGEAVGGGGIDIGLAILGGAIAVRVVAEDRLRFVKGSDPLFRCASFLAWLTALALDIKQAAVTGGVVSSRAHRHYSLLRLGWEAHRYRSSLNWSSTLKYAFAHPPPWFLKELEIPG